MTLSIPIPETEAELRQLAAASGKEIAREAIESSPAMSSCSSSSPPFEEATMRSLGPRSRVIVPGSKSFWRSSTMYLLNCKFYTTLCLRAAPSVWYGISMAEAALPRLINDYTSGAGLPAPVKVVSLSSARARETRLCMPTD
jgi:hypothetical protein